MKLAIGTLVCKHHNWHVALGIYANQTNISNLPVDVDCVAADKFQCQGSSVLLPLPHSPFTLTLLPRVTSPHHLHRRCWSSYYFLPLLTRQIVQLNGNLLIYFPLMAGKRISSFVSASLCVQSHCTMDWEWMLGFLNNNLHISNLFLESLEKKYVPWISKDNKVFYTDNVYIGSRWW